MPWLLLARTVPLALVGLPLPSRAARLWVGVVLALAALPAAEQGVAEGWPAAVHELTVGLALGFVTSVVFRAAQVAGRLVGQGPQGVTLDRLYFWLALALFGALDGPRFWAVAVGESYLALPLGSAPVGGSAVAVAAMARLVTAAVELAAPVLAALLLADLSWGLVRRVDSGRRSRSGGAILASVRGLLALTAVAVAAAALAGLLDGGLSGMGAELSAAARTLAG